MQRLFRRKNQPPRGRGRGPVPWTVWEIVLVVISLLLIVFPLYAEAYRWVNPLIVPAAQRETDTPVGSPAPTNTPIIATDTPAPTNTPTGPTDTPRPTTTPFTVTPGTVTTTPATDTPTASPASATNTPTNTPAPTNTPQPTFVGTPPLSLVKVASVASAGIGQQFSYSLSVFSNSATPRTIQVRDDIDSQLEIIGTPTASNGSCSVSGNRVSCTVTAQANRPATITITVQVRATATPGTTATNQAAASDDQSNTALSDQVVVEITNQVTPPTNTTGPPPTPGASATPIPPASATPTSGGGVTNTPAPTSGPGNTPAPTSRPRTPAPTSPPGTKPTDVPRPPLPPTPRPGQPLPATPRPGQPRQPTPRPGATAVPGTPGTPGTAVASATATPVGTPTLAPAVPGLFFRMASDWGSAFPGQEVNYVIAASNIRTSGAMNDLRISSTLPANLQILEAKADRGGDPLVTGNTVSLKLAALNPGEGVEIAIKTRIKDTVAIGTQIVSQAELTFTGLALTAHSNIVTVLVVGVAPAQVPPLQTTGTLTPTSALATATPTPTVTATATATPVPTATGAPASGAAAGAAPPPSGAPLPNTSTGVPFLGILMLGMTLMLRTVRVHREQTRI